MKPRSRLLMSLMAFGLSLGLVMTTERPAEASPVQGAGEGLCDESPFGGGTAHEFGFGGACYKCAPSATCHGTTEWGYCGTYHYNCNESSSPGNSDDEVLGHKVYRSYRYQPERCCRHGDGTSLEVPYLIAPDSARSCHDR